MPTAVDLSITKPPQTWCYYWQKPARAGFLVMIGWNRYDEGLGIYGEVGDQRGDAPSKFRLDFSETGRTSITIMLTHSDGYQPATFVDVTLTLRRDGEKLILECNLPVSDREYFSAPIDEWLPGVAPVPTIDPDGHPWPDDTDIVAAPQNGADLFPFVWLPPLTQHEVADSTLRFAPCKGYESWPLYQSLLNAADASAKRTAATAWLGGAAFVSALSGTIARMPAARLAILQMSGEQMLEEQSAVVHTLLNLPPDTTIADYLSGTEWQTWLPNGWQSIFALALAGTPTNSAIAGQLVEVIQFAHYLNLLLANDAALIKEANREEALCASASLPDAVAAADPVPNLSGTGVGSNTDYWEVLGVGNLSMARQHLQGYAPGELADIVNVMPRERQEVSENTISSTKRTTEDSTDTNTEQDDARVSSAGSELAASVAEIMAANGLIRNMDKVSPSYTNLNLFLTGAGNGSDGNSGWQGTDTNRSVQQLTEQAAKRLGERIGKRRSREWQELRERRQSQLIDNTHHDRLVGIYRWVDRLVRVHLVQEGCRLVMLFLIDHPAKPWLSRVLGKGTFPPQKPAPLPNPASNNPAYTVVTPHNYLALGAQYGLTDLVPPPAANLSLTCNVNRITLGDLSLLTVPSGYQVTDGTCTMVMADSSFNLVGTIGSVPLNFPAGATKPQTLSVTVPSCSNPTTVGDASLTPPLAPTAAILTASLSALANASGVIPVSIMTAAPLFSVTVELNCALQDASASPAVNPLLVSWQIRTHERLLAAWKAVTAKYDADVKARIAVASKDHTAMVQRETLQQACLDLLTQVSPNASVDDRELAPLFSWRHMTWQYKEWPAGEPTNWPEVIPGEATQPGDDSLFQRFLTAQTARVLLPVASAYAAWVLNYLQFQQFWVGGPATVPVTFATMPLMEVLADASCPPTEPTGWTLRLPTSMLYLQASQHLPPLLSCDDPATTR